VDIAAADCDVSFSAGWFPVEFDGVGGAYRWVENNAEVTVRRQDAAAELLGFDLEPGPSAGHQPLTLLALDGTGRVLAEGIITGRSEFTVQVPRSQSADFSFRFVVKGGGVPVPHDPRILNLAVRRCGWGKLDHPVPAIAGFPGGRLWMKLMRGLSSIAQDGTFVLPERSRLRRMIRAYVNAGGFTGALLRRNRRKPVPVLAASNNHAISAPVTKDAARPAFLHTNACGDFTLMAREHWFELRGYPEFDLFSMNLDSVLCHSAHHAGFREEVLQNPLRIYHIEHGTGSGWTPEGQAELFRRLSARDIQWLDYPDFVAMAEQMRRFASPLIFNRENWGFAEVELEETILPANSSTTAPASAH
jgi:hypothetical protein